MDRHIHLFVNAIALVLIYFWGYITGIKLPFEILVAWFIFSNLPDIDNSNSVMSAYFLIFCIGILIFGIISLVQSSILIGIVILVIGMSIIAYHFKIMDDSIHHRVFPHTFTFGLFASIILGIFTSFWIALIGFLCFCLHLTADCFYFDQYNKFRVNSYWSLKTVLDKDLRLWKGDFKIIFEKGGI